VPGKAPDFRYMRSSIKNKRVESGCNNEASRLELYKGMLSGESTVPRNCCKMPASLMNEMVRHKSATQRLLNSSNTAWFINILPLIFIPPAFPLVQ
jgi:hypothetical protein